MKYVRYVVFAELLTVAQKIARSKNIASGKDNTLDEEKLGECDTVKRDRYERSVMTD